MKLLYSLVSRKYLRTVGAVAGAVLAVAALTRCGKEETQPQQQQRRAPLVQCVQAELGTLADTLALTGEVVALNDVTLYALLEGPILHMPWREGDFVKAGEKLVEIGRPIFREELRAAEAALEVGRAKLADLMAGARPEEVRQARETVKQLNEQFNFAQSDVERIGQLVERGALPGEEHDKAQVASVRAAAELAVARERVAMLEQGPTATEIAVQKAAVAEAEAKLALARARLSESVVAAPFDGAVSQVFVSPGDMAMTRTPLLRLLDTSSLVVRVSVPESRALGVAKDAPVVARFDAYPGREFEGRVARVHPEIQRDTRTRIVEAQINDDIELAPGMFARISLQLDALENAVIVPDKAILTTPEGDAVVFVVEDDKAMRRVVTTGMEKGTNIEIVSGITPGELVVVAGHTNLRDGATVRVPGQQTGAEGGAPQGGAK